MLNLPGIKDRLDNLDKKSKRKLIKRGIIVGNIVLFLAIAVFILANRSASQTVRLSTVNSAVSTSSSVQNPLDHLSSAQIALQAAQVAKLPETTPIRNQADSDSILLTVVPHDSTVLAKPQIVATTEKSKHDIIRYITQPGDTVASLSDKYHVSGDSIRWSNNLGGNNLAPNIKLSIPPVNGIVYTVKAGDTPASLAARYRSDESLIINYNDAEISGLKPGDLIIIPNGSVQPAIVRSAAISSFAATYGYNGYDYGYCTWYVASKIPVPSNWGNANTWALYAAPSGWTVSTVPRVGAVAQTSRGFQGHVAIVEAVSPDGTTIKYSDMNGLAGWGRVGYSDWVSSSYYQHYIYR